MAATKKHWQRMPPPPSIAGQGEATGWGALALLALAYFALREVDHRTRGRR